MKKSDMLNRNIGDIVSLFYQSSFEPDDLLDVVLENIRRFETKLHSFVFLEQESSLRLEADRLKSEISKGKVLPLCGIPIAVKDNTNVSGMPCTGGSRLFKDFVPAEDSFAISALRKNGAIILGKTNLDEMGAFGIETNNPLFGRTFNPWDLGRTPGGSSGGSAAAVASSEAIAATGSDTGGSVRIPAAFCGVTGMKPTYGRIGRYGTFGMSWSLDHLGVIARSAQDAQLLVSIMGERDPQDSSTANAPPVDHGGHDHPNLKGVKIATLANPLVDSDDGVLGAFDAAVDLIREAGASFSELSLRYFSEIKAPIFAIALAETAAYHEQWFRDSHSAYGERLKKYVQLGHGVLATQYLKALRQKTVITKSISEQLRSVDALLLPTSPSIAPELNQETIEIKGAKHLAFEVLTENTYPFNFLGLPAISIPIGFSKDMPVGIQIVSAHWKESMVYRIAGCLQQMSEYHVKRPPI